MDRRSVPRVLWSIAGLEVLRKARQDAEKEIGDAWWGWGFCVGRELEVAIEELEEGDLGVADDERGRAVGIVSTV